MGSIIGNFAQAGTYKAQASIARSQGRAAKESAYKQAYNLEEEARADSYIAGKNLMRMRENQTDAVAGVRAALAANGFTREGSGRNAEIAAADVFETAIRDAALSNAVSDYNKRHAAEVTRYQGDMAELQQNLTAQQYDLLAKNARTSAWLQAGATAISAGTAYAVNAINGQPAQIQATDAAGNGLFDGKGNPLMVANPDYYSPLSAGKAAFDLSGDALTFVPGSVNTASRNGGSYMYKFLADLLGEKQEVNP